MARKLSRIAKQGILWFAAVGTLLAAHSAQAQSKVQVSETPQPIIQNPFAAGAEQKPAIVPDEPQSPSRLPTTFHNPFALQSKTPPIQLPRRSGPISRWQRPSRLPADPSSVKGAILSGDQPKSIRMHWDQLPDDLGPDEPISQAEIPASAEPSVPPDPIHFAPRPLQQPPWLTLGDQAAEKSTTLGQEDGTHQDLFDLPRSAANSGVIGGEQSTGYLAKVAGNSGRSLTGIVPADADLLPTIVSEYVDSPDGWYIQAEQAAQTAESTDQLAAVIEFCKRGLNGKPSPSAAASLQRLGAWACNRRGELQIEAGRHQEALQDFQLAISWDATCSLAIHNRAVTFAQQEQFADALRDFNRVIELNPGLAVAYRNRAELLATLGRTDEAVRDYTQAITQLSEDTELLRARSHAYHRLGELDRALDDLNAAIQLDSEEPLAYTERGNLSAERGDFEHALADFQHAIDLDPRCIEAYRSLAWFQSTCPTPRFRSADVAVEAATRAVKLAPVDDCFLLDALAAAQANAGNYDEAVRVLDRAVVLAPIDFAPQLRERLELYRQNRPYRSGPVPAIATAVRTASHNSSSPRPSPTVRKPIRADIER